MERPLEIRPYIGMARSALRVDFGRFSRHQPVRPVLMNGMATDTAHLVSDMTAIDASHVRGLIQVTAEADAIGFGWLELGRIAYVGRRHGLGMLASRSVTRFAGFVFEPALFVGFHQFVRALLKGVEDILVASLADDGTGEFRRLGGLGRLRLRECPACPGRPSASVTGPAASIAPSNAARRRRAGGDTSRTPGV